MDLRLSEALGTTPGYWLALQVQRDLWTAGQTAKARKLRSTFFGGKVMAGETCITQSYPDEGGDRLRARP